MTAVGESKGHRRSMSGRARLVAVFVGLLLGWLAAEGLLAALGLPTDELIFLAKDGSVDWDCYCSNPRGYFVERKGPGGQPIYCVDHTDDPPRVVRLDQEQYADHYKILTVGDSFTWGLGVKVDDGYPRVLGRRLAEASGRPVVVANYANVGRMITEIQEELRQALAFGFPDLCVYGYVLNDPFDGTTTRTAPLAPADKAATMDNADIDDFINVRTSNLKKFRLESPGGWLRRQSRLVDLALRQWEWSRIHRRTIAYYRDLYDPVENAQGLLISWNALHQMKQLLGQADKRFLVVIFPLFVDVDGNYPFVTMHQTVARRLEALGIDYLDLLPVYHEYPTPSLWVHPLDRHPNEVAHRIAADAIAEYVLARGWLTPTGNQGSPTASSP